MSCSRVWCVPSKCVDRPFESKKIISPFTSVTDCCTARILTAFSFCFPSPASTAIESMSSPFTTGELRSTFEPGMPASCLRSLLTHYTVMLCCAVVQGFVEKLVENPALIATPELAFLRNGLAKLGLPVPGGASAASSKTQEPPKPAAAAAEPQKPKSSPAPEPAPTPAAEDSDDDLEPKEFVWTGSFVRSCGAVRCGVGTVICFLLGWW